MITECFSEDEFENYLVDLFAAVAPGDRFILGIWRQRADGRSFQSNKASGQVLA